jgi:hypothetical protein
VTCITGSSLYRSRQSRADIKVYGNADLVELSVNDTMRAARRTQCACMFKATIASWRFPVVPPIASSTACAGANKREININAGRLSNGRCHLRRCGFRS